MAQYYKPRAKEVVVEKKIEPVIEKKQEVVVKDVELSKEEQAMINKAVLDANNTEKAKKDVMLMRVKDLEAHIKFLTERMVEMDNEYRSRRKLVDGINGSIAGAQAELSQVRANVQKQNESLIKELNDKMAEVNKSDETLRKLISENQALNVSNKQKESALNDEKLICASQVYEMKKALAQNESERVKREADIAIREKALKDERDTFEAEKSSLLPELNKISSIKNDNILLLQEIERQRVINNNMLLGIESEKTVLEEAKLVEASKARTMGEKLANEEKRLREWEQNLKDFDLETRAKSAKADKLIRQYQLEKEASSK